MTDDEWLARFGALARKVGAPSDVRPQWGHRAVRAWGVCRTLSDELDRHAPGAPRRSELARDYARAYHLLTEAQARCWPADLPRPVRPPSPVDP